MGGPPLSGRREPMTRARRRVVRLAFMLKEASIEPVYLGCNSYGEIQARLALQFAGLAPNRRKALRRQALLLISKAGGLATLDHLVPRPLQQRSPGWAPRAIQPFPNQLPRRPPETPRCPVCRMRSGRGKRSYPSQAEAQRICEMQKDPRLVVYACLAGNGFHLGHPNTNAETILPPAPTTQRRESLLNEANEAPMLPTSRHKTSPTMQATLGHPVLIFLYSTALLLIGCGIGRHWIHTPVIWCCLVGGTLMVVHDLATGFLWFFLSARWVRSVMTQRN